MEPRALSIPLPVESLDLLADLVAERLRARGLISDSPWKTADQAAKYLGTTRKGIYQAAAAGKLRAESPNESGRPLLFHVSELDGYARGLDVSRRSDL